MDEKERKSCIFTINTLMNLAYNIHGVMDVVDVDNCKKIIEMLDSGYLTGRWIPTASGKGRHECSRCHEYAPCYQDGSEHLSTFCVLCGAKMEEGEQE